MSTFAGIALGLARICRLGRLDCIIAPSPLRPLHSSGKKRTGKRHHLVLFLDEKRGGRFGKAPGRNTLKLSVCGARIRSEKLYAASGLLTVTLLASALAGCGSPTYGTGVTAEQQLLEDVTGVLSLAPKNRQPIDYAPRSELVKPPSMEVLPPPQEKIATPNNPAWPESPEQRLARIRAEATANQDNPRYRPNIIRDIPAQEQARALTRQEQREEVLRRRQIANQGSPTTRRYLSDPPLDLRQPAPTAPIDELGEDEWKKQRAARQTGSTGGLRRLLPW